MKIRIPILIVVASSMLMASPRADSKTSVPEAARMRFHEAQAVTADVASSASDLNGMVDSKVSWATQSTVLAKIRTDFQKLSKNMTWMEQHQAELSPWQQDLYRRVYSKLAIAAANANLAIESVRQNGQGKLLLSPYRTYLKAVEEDTRNADETIQSFLQYDRDRQNEQKIQQALHIAGSE